MTTSELAHQLVQLCQTGQFHEAISTLYAPDIVSVEAAAGPGGDKEMQGLDAVLAKGKWWTENHEVHGGSVDGPLVAGNHFCVKFTFDVTFKPTGQRFTMQELGMYQVKDGKVVREEFFYSMG
jgi:hypothetical protein